ncbi:hypothetical protein ABZ557_03505 [Streptomyces sp. NPDC019645]|uniref:hypothetical protein n=1 Tax=Streptomyces sp. NPDC019645 TaxID=3154786 RepID=UPI003407A17D
MADVLLALCIPLTLCASGLYAVCDSWWRRRRRGAVQPRHLYPGVCSYVYAYEHPRAHAGARLAEREMLTAAEEIVDTAYAKLAWLYDGACPGPDAGANGETDADAGAGAEPSADRLSADSTADHGPSRPASARTVTRPPEH